MIDRVIRAIRLDATLYREVADDEQYTSEAFMIVLVVALFGAIGTAISAIGDGQPLLVFFSSLFSTILLGWLLWAVIAYYVGTALEGNSSIMEMARTLGYANAPRILALFAFIPCIGWFIAIAGWLLSLAAGVIAIRESMEFDTTKALVTAILGLVLFIVANVFIIMIVGRLGAAGASVLG